jgi:ribosomal protein S13
LLSGISFQSVERLDPKSIIVWTRQEAYEVIDNGIITIKGPGILYTWHVSNDQGQRLYGFDSIQALRLARLIESKCDGIGPAVASMMCQVVDYPKLAVLIANKDIKGITSSIQGIGTKKAETLCTKLSLKDVGRFMDVATPKYMELYKKVTGSLDVIFGKLITDEERAVSELIRSNIDEELGKLIGMATTLITGMRSARTK